MSQTNVERARAALERALGTSVQVFPRADWDASLRANGEPTLLPEPYGPYTGILGNPVFQSAVASGASFAPQPGFHHVRRDEADAPDVINTDSYDVILDLTADPRWAEVLRVSGLTDSPRLRSVIRRHVFAHLSLRPDHHSPEVPDDIRAARSLADRPVHEPHERSEESGE